LPRTLLHPQRLRGGKRKHVSRFVLLAELQVEALDFSIAGEQDIDFAAEPCRALSLVRKPCEGQPAQVFRFSSLYNHGSQFRASPGCSGKRKRGEPCASSGTRQRLPLRPQARGSPSIVPKVLLLDGGTLLGFSGHRQVGCGAGRFALQLQGELPVVARLEILIGADNALHQLVAHHVGFVE